MNLYGSNFTLRPWRSGDEPSLLKYANNPNVAIYLGNRFPSPYTAADASSWIELKIKQQAPLISLAIVIGEDVVGGIGIELQTDIYCKNAKIGYWLGEPFWGKGIMVEVLTLFTVYVFDLFDVTRIYARVFASNPASAKVLQKVGFKQEGFFKKALFKDGWFDDELIFAILRS